MKLPWWVRWPLWLVEITLWLSGLPIETCAQILIAREDWQRRNNGPRVS